MRPLAAALFLFCTAHPAFAAKQYSYVRVGSAADVTAATTPGTVLMGGSTDVDAAFQWMCARSSAGDFLVIRATGTDAYNPYIHVLHAGARRAAGLRAEDAAHLSDISVYRIDSTSAFDVARWAGRGGVSYFVSANAGVLSSTQPGGAIY